ncbi:siroheme synthase 1 [Alishewanella longhuensis]
MQYLPLFVKLTDKPVLIVGGGSVALRKAGTLLSAGAKLSIVSPEFAPEFLAWQAEGKAELLQGYFEPQLLDGKLLVIAATDNDDVNAAVYEAATVRNMLVNTVDDQPKCGFIFPSIIDRSPILIAISSFGTAPVLARRLREKLETLLPYCLSKFPFRWYLASPQQPAVRPMRVFR